MAHEPPHQPSAGNNSLDFNDYDFGSLNGLSSQHRGQVESDSNRMADSFDAAGNSQIGNDMMSAFGNGMLDPIGAMPMNLESADDSSLSQGFEPGGNFSSTDSAVALAENRFNTASNNVPGAGPLPLDARMQMGMGGTGVGTLTEFTKRRNWPAKVVEELRDWLLIMDANGRIKYSSPSVLPLTGYTTDEMHDAFLKDRIHPDDQGLFVADVNEAIASGNSLRLFYRLKRKDGDYIIFEAIGHAHIAAAKFAPNPSNQSPFCQAVYMMARPYPTRNAGLLDSFLEHKIENERLKRRIAELRREEELDANEAQKQWLQGQESRSDITVTEDTMTAVSTPYHYPSHTSADAPQSALESSLMNSALTRENLEGAVAEGRHDSLRDKMARFEGAYTDTIEMLTGLRYLEGERSRGITTGNASPTLIKGDAGIAIPMDRDPRTGEKKKKIKTSEEYVCTDCGKFRKPPVYDRKPRLTPVTRHSRFTRMAQGAKWTENALQRLRPTVGQEGEEKAWRARQLVAADRHERSEFRRPVRVRGMEEQATTPITSRFWFSFFLFFPFFGGFLSPFSFVI